MIGDPACRPGPTYGVGVTDRHPFLSDAWIAAARGIRDRRRDVLPDPPVPTSINVVVTDIPHRDDLDGHLDTRSGTSVLEEGHLDDAELTVTLDYHTARSMFVDADPQAVMQAFFAGKIFVEGDASRLMAVQQPPPQPGDPVLEVYEEIRGITSDD